MAELKDAQQQEMDSGLHSQSLPTLIYIHIFESSQLEGPYVEDLMFLWHLRGINHLLGFPVAQW